MKNKIKIILITIISFMVGINVCYAKDYVINSSNFEVELEVNGSAHITEEWNVTFKGEYTKFDKEFLTNINDVEKYDGFEIEKVYINNKEIELTDNKEDRPNYTYYVDDSSENKYTIEWYKYMDNETVTFKVRYKIDNIVKKVDESTAIFAYRFVNYNVDKTIYQTTLNINLLSSEMEVYDKVGYVDQNQNGNVVTFSNGERKGAQKIVILMPLDNFTDLTTASLDDLEEVSDIVAVIIILIPVFFIVVISALLTKFAVKNKKKKVEEVLLENSDYIDDVLADIRDVDIFDIAYYYDIKLSSYQKVVLALLNLNFERKCTINNNEIIINNTVFDRTDISSFIVKELKNNIEYKEIDNKTVFDINNITNYINKHMNKYFRVINKYIDNKYGKKKISKEVKEEKELIKDIFKYGNLYGLYTEYNKISVSDLIIKSMNNLTTKMDLFSVLFVDFVRTENDDKKSDAAIFVFCYYAMNDIISYSSDTNNISSDSGGSCIGAD